MTRISDLAALLIKNAVPDDSIKVCAYCFGSKMEVFPGKGARTCRCVRETMRRRLIASFPERNTRFGIPALEDLKTFVPMEQSDQGLEVREKIVAWQKRLIRHVQTNPFSSLNLCGKNKIGKSQIALSVLLNAFDAGRRVKFFKMKELLSDYAEAARQSFSAGMSGEETYRQTIVPRLTVREVSEYEGKYTIVIDEFHNWILSSTEAQFSTVFELLDAVKASRHQLVLLSNYPFEWLREGMYARRSKLGESVRFVADAILSRVLEEAATEELFF